MMSSGKSNAGFDDDGEVTLKAVINHHDSDFIGGVSSNNREKAKVSRVSNITDSSSGISSDGGCDDQDLGDVLEAVIEEEETGVQNKKDCIAILGSGDFGRALGGRLVQAGYEVVIGSRDPQRNS